MTLCAIDPGASGGIAWRFDSGLTVCAAMPDTEGDTVALIRTIAPATFYLEDLVKHMGAGIPASTMAVYASNWGFLKGCIQYSGSELHLIRPQQWIKALGLGKSTGMEKRDWKNKLKAEAQRLYPSLTVTLKTADALLLLTYAMKQATVSPAS